MTNKRLHPHAAPVVVYFPFMAATSAFTQTDLHSMADPPGAVATARFGVRNESTQTSKEAAKTVAARLRLSDHDPTRLTPGIRLSGNQGCPWLPTLVGEPTPH